MATVIKHTITQIATAEDDEVLARYLQAGWEIATAADVATWARTDPVVARFGPRRLSAVVASAQTAPSGAPTS